MDLPFMDDGRNKWIDFVLVYESENGLPDTPDRTGKREKREDYEARLVERFGLELETKESTDGRMKFVKIHMPWESLCECAEWLHIKLPIKVPRDDDDSEDDHREEPHISGDLCDLCESLFCGHLPCNRGDVSYTRMDNDTETTITAPFEKHREDHFNINPNDSDKTFPPPMRIRMVYYILSTEIGTLRDTDMSGVNITKLLAEGVYQAAYPLHDCSLNPNPNPTPGEDDNNPKERFELYRDWAHISSFYKTQPLDHIRKYCGEKIAMYFAWLGFYTFMLIIASIVGIICFIYGLATGENATWSKEVCDPEIGGTIVMCPQCDKKCDYWKLNSTCGTSKVLSKFDNYGTMVFAVFMSIWVTLFLEFWTRKQAKLKYKWDTMEFQEQEELPRPEYLDRCNESSPTRPNPVTCKKEKVPYTPCERRARISLGIVALLFMVLVILAFVVAIIVYSMVMIVVFSDAMGETQGRSKYVTPQLATSVTASVISFVIITILDFLYKKVAKRLTDYEIPRTQTEYENSLSLKIFVFQFVNNYGACFYIAFFKGQFIGYPGQPAYIGTFRNEECNPEGCMMALTIQLAVILSGETILNLILQVSQTFLSGRWKNWKRRPLVNADQDGPLPRWEQDYKLLKNKELRQFYEYLEMVIQFGFVTMFVASFPLAPFLAFLNNLLEIRIDAWKTTSQFRRMVPEMAQDIGVWLPILQAISILAVTTNVMIMAFTSDMIPRLVYFWDLSVYQYGHNSTYTMKGYINNTLSVFNISDFTNQSKPEHIPDWFANGTTCRYRDFRYPPGHPKQYEHSNYYWHVLAARLAFIVAVVHIIYLVKVVLIKVIPDVPKDIKTRIKREQYLTQNILYQAIGQRSVEEPTLSDAVSERERPSQESRHISSLRKLGTSLLQITAEVNQRDGEREATEEHLEGEGGGVEEQTGEPPRERGGERRAGGAESERQSSAGAEEDRVAGGT